jgi:RHS repeat-associated protein
VENDRDKSARKTTGGSDGDKTRSGSFESAAGTGATDRDSRGTAPPLVHAQVPALPTGGGAVRGIGEKFSTNAVTGTGGLSIPIPLTPARGAPSLDLSYNSGSGNGPFGAGWSVTAPRIARKTDLALPTYLDADGDDLFVLTGAEDLVPIATRGTAATGIITTYQPRVEAAYARIERHQDATGTWWQTFTCDNVRSVFGQSAAARICDPSNPARIFAWLIESSADAAGNITEFDYIAEDLTNVAPSSAELHRLDHTAPCTNTYLSAVRYGNLPNAGTSGGATQFAFSLVFDYGDHVNNAPDRTPGIWPVRPDPFSSYRAGFDVRVYRRCQRVLMFHSLPELGAAPRLVRSLELSYDTDPALSHLIGAELRGYDDAGAMLAVPALQLAYTQANTTDAGEVCTLDAVGDLPAGVDSPRHQWIDLDAEGIAGVLTDGDGGLFYRRNLGGGALGPARPVAPAPAFAAPTRTSQRFMALDGDGRMDLVELGTAAPGFYARVVTTGVDQDGGDWEALQPFTSLPQLDWGDPNVRFIDLDGDGLEDILIARDNTFLWYPSLGTAGYDAPRVLPRPDDEETGPAIIFADPRRTIALADLSGDGLRDLVRVENGSVCYWPNLGQGRFGAKVTMDASPVFDLPDQFQPARVLFADIDGTGTSDLLYAGANGVTYWLNRGGNSWSPPVVVDALPPDHNAASITAIDVLGSGTACLAWTSSMPGDTAIRYVDLMGGVKPHLLAQIDNQLGLTTRIAYAPSTSYYLADRAAGIHWQTQLPFPVHVVARVEVDDAIRRVRFVSEYSYRNGYFDGYEREYRGFGYVEQRDTESDPAELGKGLFADRPPPVNDEYPQPPIVTKTWFHTGVWLDPGPTPGMLAFDPGAVATPLTPAESRDAYRALRGRPLHVEIYSDDGTAQAGLPYQVTQHGYTVVRLVPAAGELHGVFAANPRETITTASERVAGDARIKHDLVIEVDQYGHIRKQVAIGYGSADPSARLEQLEQLATLVETDVINAVDPSQSWYRHGVPLETRTYQLYGLATAAAGATLAWSDVENVATVATAIPYDAAVPAGYAKRLLARSRAQYYDGAALPGAQQPLAFGTIDALALPYGAFGVAFTESLVQSLYGGRVTDAILTAGGYVQLADDPGSWYTTSGRSVPDPAKFYLPTTYLDPFGAATQLAYDAHLLGTASVTDALGNVIASTIDYRVMKPSRVTDPNGAAAQVAFDALGRVTSVWQTGPAGEGDPVSGTPTGMSDYTFYNAATGQPSCAHTRARETYALATTKWQESWAYTDGAGMVVLTKIQTEPGADNSPRWIGSGRTVFDNKGNVLKQYEPYFAATSAYDDESAIAAQGVTPLFHYDALNRLVLTEFPDGSTARIEFTPWQSVHYDRNDTVLDGGNVWYARATTGSTVEQRAAQVTSPHANTPTTVLFDSLGRMFSTIADNGGGSTFETKTSFDISGNPQATLDALGRACVQGYFDMLGRFCHHTSIDGGERWDLFDTVGKRLARWDSRGQLIEASYDALRREIATSVTPSGGTKFVAHKIVWGESAPASVTYARARVYQRYDGAGVVTCEAYDFRGNLTSSTRQLATHYDSSLDWSQSQPLEVDVFRTQSAFDALGRPTQVTTPDGSVYWLSYNATGLLATVDIQLRGAAQKTSFVSAIDYNEKSQRTRIVYGQASTTTYGYDPLTYRIAAIDTARTSDGAPLQALAFAYDPAGNIVQLTDSVQQPIFYAGGVVDGTALYTFEPTYRLASATGREQAAGFGGPRTDVDIPVAPLPHPNDGQALIAYLESYQYDAVGNVLQISHGPPGGAAAWLYPMRYVAGTNRLDQTMVAGDQQSDATWHGRYSYDPHGNMIAMPHLSTIAWDWNDRMQSAALGGGGTVYFTYDAQGERVRKVWVHGGTIDERIYLGGYEVYRQSKSGSVALERQTLHVTTGADTLALVETKTIDTSVNALVPTPVIRFQLSNQLGSALWEIDSTGQLISYEEYHPFGTSAYRAQSTIDVSQKRYRYNGKERDEETSLYYYGARYYAPWLARWTAADGMGVVAGINFYAFCSDNPIVRIDPDGHDDVPLHYPPRNASEDAAWRAYQRGSSALTPDQIAAVYQTCPQPDYTGPKTEEQAQAATNRIQHEAAKDAQRRADWAAHPPLTKEERWKVAQQGARNWLINKLDTAATVALLPVAGPGAFLLKPDLSSLKAPEPPKYATNLREYQTIDSYEHAQTTLDVTEAALSFVPWAEMGEAASLAWKKAPTPVPSLGNLGGMHLMSFDEKFELLAQRELKALERSSANIKIVEESKFGQETIKRYNAEKKFVEANTGGFDDFSHALYTEGPNDVNIGLLRGSDPADFAAANKAAGYKSTPAGYTWHHHEDLGRMQLVRTDVHAAASHSGGRSIWKKVFGIKDYH